MQWYARICFAFTYSAIPADAYLLNGYALNGYVWVGWVFNGYVLKRYVLVGYVFIGYVLKRYVLNGYVLKRYVWNDVYWYAWSEICQQSSEEPCDETSFGKNVSFCLHVDQGGGTTYYSKGFANHNAEHGHCFTTNFLSYLLTRCTIKRVRDVFAHNLHRLCGWRVLFYYVFSGVQHVGTDVLQGCLLQIPLFHLFVPHWIEEMWSVMGNIIDNDSNPAAVVLLFVAVFSLLLSCLWLLPTWWVGRPLGVLRFA